jgi:chemotaxis protein MotB
MSDRDPFVPNDPKDPRNRRISIVLLRQSIPPADTQGTAPVAPQAPAGEAVPVPK